MAVVLRRRPAILTAPSAMLMGRSWRLYRRSGLWGST